MKMPLAALAAAAMWIAAPAAEAAVVHTDYTIVSGTRWMVDITVVNDGAPPATISNFTVDFPDFTNLELVSSPATWDTIVVQPDPSLPDDGFLDSLAIDPGDALTLGESIAGFRMLFDYDGVPHGAPFVISDSSFTPLFFGTTVVTVMPEPGSALLLALGLGAAFGAARRARGDGQTSRS